MLVKFTGNLRGKIPQIVDTCIGLQFESEVYPESKKVEYTGEELLIALDKNNVDTLGMEIFPLESMDENNGPGVVFDTVRGAIHINLV